MKKLIITSTMCTACDGLKAGYTGVETRDINAYGPLSYVLQALFGKTDIRTPIVIVLAEGNGRESRMLLDLEVGDETAWRG